MAKKRRPRSNLVDFDSPPVIEVVYGVKFAPLVGWKVPHVGAFWKEVFDRFPLCEHAPPIAAGGHDFIDPATNVPLPRVWLINRDDDRLVQLQPGRFLFNWRWREASGSYPRYEVLSKEFAGLFAKFQKFIDGHELGELEIQEFELTYINHVFERDGWKLPDITGQVVDHLIWDQGRYRFLPRPETINWQAKFVFGDQPGGLFAKLGPAKHTKREAQLLILELSARGLPAEAPAHHMMDWFGHAHQWIVRGFEDLTTETAQKELWGKHVQR